MHQGNKENKAVYQDLRKNLIDKAQEVFQLNNVSFESDTGMKSPQISALQEDNPSRHT